MKKMAVAMFSLIGLLTFFACSSPSGGASPTAPLSEVPDSTIEIAAEAVTESTEETAARENAGESEVMSSVGSAEKGETGSAKGSKAAEGTRSTESGGEQQTLRIYVPAYSEGAGAWWASFKERFEANHDEIRLILTVVSPGALDAGLSQAIRKGLPPDIVAVHDFSQAAAKGKLLSTNHLAIADMKVRFFEGLWEAGCLKGTSYGIPLAVSTRAFYYNKDIFDKAGISSAPSTWDELREACRLIKAACGEEVTPLGLDFSGNEGAMTLAAFAGKMGGFVDEEGTLALNTQSHVETLNYLGDLIRSGYTNQDPTGDGRQTLWEAFAGGSIAMLIAPPALSDFLAAKTSGVRCVFTSVPVKEAGTGTAPALCDCFVVTQNKKANQEARNEAISLFFTALYDDDIYADYVRSEGFLPVTYTAALAMAENDFGMESWMGLLATARHLPDMAKGWDLAKTGITEAIKAAAQNGNAAGVLAAAQAAIQQGN